MINTSLESSQMTADTDEVLRLADVNLTSLTKLLSNYGLALKTVTSGHRIPGSFWGDEEAGLIGNELLAREDTPIHSILHEACHFVCMDKVRRTGIHTDAGGDYDEENAVCYLQILLADHIEEFSQLRMLADMDRWGYSFRLGSARDWFEKDADDARAFLLARGLIDRHNRSTFKLREG